MKIKIICIVILLFVLFPLSAIDIPICLYLGTNKTVNIYDEYQKSYSNRSRNLEKGQVIGDIKKLTREDTSLLWKALNEYDYKMGEVYRVMIFFGRPAGRYVELGYTYYLFVEIQKDNSCNWCGYAVYEPY
ncbi:MAG: hypothetical protein IKZ86_13460 [Spirochaetaceae bacterium]|nr:hypothetical protein [Spirochaetaceae bacterium]